MSKFKPYVFMNGDESARDAATMALSILFDRFPVIHADTGVENRILTDDQCIHDAAAALLQYRGGVKISTASNHEKIKAKNWKSANILLRPLAGCIGMFRITFGEGRYVKPVGVARYGSGDFYAEKSCDIQTIDGARVAVITQHMNVDDLEPFARIAANVSKSMGLQMIYSSKWTISRGEQLLPEECKKVWTEMGLVEGAKRGEGDYYGEITDMSAAYIPGNITIGKADAPISGFNGGWLIVTGNANGDTFGDVMDFQHGGKGLGSEVACRAGFSYQESPGGTAPGRYKSDYKGPNFFIPMDTLNSFGRAIADINPEAKPYCDAVMAKGWEYLAGTADEDRGTEKMLHWIAEETATERDALFAV